MSSDLQDATEQIPFSEAPENSHGRKRHAREEVFGVCICGDTIHGNQVDDDVVACTRAGCKFGLVSATTENGMLYG